MRKHAHEFVETYAGLVGYGLDRETNERTLRIYLQKFSDDRLMETILGRMSDEDLDEVYELILRMMKKHLSEGEYHRLFLKGSRPDDSSRP